MAETSWLGWLSRSRKVVFFGNLVSLFCILGTSGILLNNVYKKTSEQLDSNAKFAAELLKVPAGNAIWNFDTQALEIIRKQTKNDLIDSVRFLDKDGKPVIEDEKLELGYETFQVTEKVIDGKGEVGGSITVIYNKRHLWTSFRAEAQNVFILLGLIVIIQVASLLGATWSSSRMLKAINILIDQIRSASEITLSQASGVGASADKNLNLATTQASAVQRTVAAADEISAMMGHTSSRIEHSSGTARESLEAVKSGVKNIEKMTSTVRQIEETTHTLFDSVTTSATKIDEIRSRMQMISDKTQVINDIVFQTKLLSFNASVEAARAGEHGRGFAVVAEEIGNLAVMSGKASADIDQILRDSLAFTKEITEELSRELSGSIEKSRTCVASGVDLTNESSALLKQIHTNIEALMSDMHEVVRANEEQSAGVKSISAAMNEIDAATHASMESIKSTESAVSELIQQASVLAGIVSQAAQQNATGDDQGSDHHEEHGDPEPMRQSA